MSIETAEQLSALQTAGRIARRMLDTMRRHVRPGVTTRELDELGAEVMRRDGAKSAPALGMDSPEQAASASMMKRFTVCPVTA